MTEDNSVGDSNKEGQQTKMACDKKGGEYLMVATKMVGVMVGGGDGSDREAYCWGQMQWGGGGLARSHLLSMLLHTTTLCFR